MTILPGMIFSALPGCREATSPTPISEGRAADQPAVDTPLDAPERLRGWQGDIDFLLAEIRRQHYVYRSRPLPEALETRARKLREAIPRFSDERMLFEAQGLMALLGDGHCYILPAGARRVSSTQLPVRFYHFSDGLFVIDTEAGYERWIGSKVLRFGALSTEDSLSRIDEFISRDNEMTVRWLAPFLLRFRGTQEVIGFEGGAVGQTLTLQDRDGQVAKERFEFGPVPRLRGVPKLIPSKLPGAPAVPLYLSDVSTPYWFRDLPDSRVLYVQFNQVMNAPKEPLRAFAGRLAVRLKDSPPHVLIVDVRHNNGGNAELLPPLVAVLKEFEAGHPDAKLVIIMGRNTFSAAQIFISQMNRLTKAIFAGESSSSKPNFVGEENEIILPWSGAIGSISNRYHESIPGDTRSSIEPIIKVELSSRLYFANRAPVLEEVLRSAQHTPLAVRQSE
jgi:hypothetical protein